MTASTRPGNSLALTFADSLTMLRRNLVHAVRYPIVVYLTALPVVFMMMFVYVFGGTLGAGMAGGGMAGGGTGDYLTYVVPGVLLLTLGGGVTGPAVSVSKDLTEGIIARFRTMDISRSAVLSGHVLGNVIQMLIALIAVTVVALAMGFRSPTSALAWLGAAAFLALIAYALCWLGAAFGVFANGVESASNLPAPLLILPFLGSGFVPTATMPGWLQWFADYQPFTPFTEVVRTLMLGTPMGASLWLSLGWIAVIGIGGWAWARSLYERKTLR